MPQQFVKIRERPIVSVEDHLMVELDGGRTWFPGDEFFYITYGQLPAEDGVWTHIGEAFRAAQAGAPLTHKGELKLLDGQQVALETWELYDVSIMEINLLDGDIYDEVNTELKLKYDHVIYRRP